MPSTVPVPVPAGARTGPFGMGMPSGPIDERTFATARLAADNENTSTSAPSSQRFTRARIVSADVRLLAVIERVQRHPVPVFLVGIALEALVMALIGEDDARGGLRRPGCGRRDGRDGLGALLPADRDDPRARAGPATRSLEGGDAAAVDRGRDRAAAALADLRRRMIY